MEWVTVFMVALAGFFGAGTYALWRDGHKTAGGVLAALALICLAVGIIALIPGPSES